MSEQNPADWLRAAKEGVKAVLDGRDASCVKGISFGGQMHGSVLLDKCGNVIRPAILWNDGRTGEETDYLNNVVGKDTLRRLTEAAHRQHCICGIHSAKAALAQKTRAGQLCQGDKDNASQGLSCL